MRHFVKRDLFPDHKYLVHFAVLTFISLSMCLSGSAQPAVASAIVTEPGTSSPGVQLTQWESVARGPFSPLNILTVLASIAMLYITRQAWNARPRLTDVQQQPVTTPPDDLHPAYAGVIASGRVRDSQIEAMFLELIRRGAILLEPDNKERANVQIRVINPDAAEIPAERELIALLEKRMTDGVVNYRSLKRLRNEWGDVRKLIQREMSDRGWLNPSITQTRLPFLVPGMIGLALAGANVVVAIAAGDGWPILGALLAGTAGIIVLSAGNIIPQTTLEGERAAIPWRGLRAGLAQARDDTHGTLDLDQLFAYVVAMGLAAPYDRQLRRASQSGYIPAWIGRRARVQEWPEGWHTYWIALHTALAPTDPANTTSPAGSPWRRSLTGGR